MAHQVVGLDIGTYTIKAAVFQTTFRSMTLSNLIESSPIGFEDMNPETHAQTLSKAISQFIDHYQLRNATFCSTLSGKDVILRIKEYPFGAKQVLKILTNDIADEIPIPIEDLMIEHHHFITEKNRTVTHAVCVQNEMIQNHLSMIQAAGIEPSLISVDSLTLLNVQQFLQHHPHQNFAIVDIGHSKTSICIISQHELAFVRTLYTGGRDINEKVRQHLDLTLDQSIEVKEKHGVIESDQRPLQSKDLKKLSFAIQSVIDPLFREILQTFHMYRAQNYLTQDRKQISHVFFCGGTSLVRNLPHYFTSLVNTPASVIDFSQTGVELNSTSCAKFATAIGTALKFASKSKQQLPKDQVNYRKGPYSLVQDYGKYKDKGLFYIKWFGVFFTLLLILFSFKSLNLRQEYKNIEKAASKSFEQYIPGTKIASSTNAVKALTQKVSELEQKQVILTSGLDQLTALGVLRELSMRIPSTIKLDTEELSIDQNKVTLRAQTDSFASVDQIIGYLEQVPFFDRIEKGNMKEKENRQIQFQITILIGEEKPSPDAGEDNES
ncbi:MAG: pilus assembly protein PilM [Bdellovibrionales bacterium]|nr:pilus assembly protein PilM [Bdellovibrionales bacterium]